MLIYQPTLSTHPINPPNSLIPSAPINPPTQPNLSTPPTHPQESGAVLCKAIQPDRYLVLASTQAQLDHACKLIAEKIPPNNKNNHHNNKNSNNSNNNNNINNNKNSKAGGAPYSAQHSASSQHSSSSSQHSSLSSSQHSSSKKPKEFHRLTALKNKHSAILTEIKEQLRHETSPQQRSKLGIKLQTETSLVKDFVRQLQQFDNDGDGR